MKKFVLLCSIGSHEYVNCKHVINCTVKDKFIVREADTAQELAPYCPQHVIYEDGYWKSFNIEPRRSAKSSLAPYLK